MTLFVSPRITEPNLNGIIAAGWTYEFFEAGTSTPKTVYSDASLGTAIGTTVTSDASGRFPVIYIEDTYKVVLKDDTDTVIWTTDGLAAGGTGLTSLSPVSYAVAAGESAVTVNTYDPNTNTVLWFLNSNPVFDGTETNATTFTLASAAVKASTLFQLQFNAMDIGTAAASNVSATQGNLQTWMDDTDTALSGTVYPHTFGAVSDYDHGTDAGTDNSTALHDMWEWVRDEWFTNGNVYKVDLSGNYLISDTLEDHSLALFVMDFPGEVTANLGSKIAVTGAKTCPIFQIGTYATNSLVKVFEGVRVKSVSGTHAGCVVADSFQGRTQYNDIYTENCTTGHAAVNVQEVFAKGLVAHTSSVASLHVTPNLHPRVSGSNGSYTTGSGTSICNNNTFDIVAQGFDVDGVIHSQGVNNRFSGLIQGGTYTGYSFDSVEGAVALTDLYFEATTHKEIRIQGGSANLLNVFGTSIGVRGFFEGDSLITIMGADQWQGKFDIAGTAAVVADRLPVSGITGNTQCYTTTDSLKSILDKDASNTSGTPLNRFIHKKGSIGPSVSKVLLAIGDQASGNTSKGASVVLSLFNEDTSAQCTAVMYVNAAGSYPATTEVIEEKIGTLLGVGVTLDSYRSGGSPFHLLNVRITEDSGTDTVRYEAYIYPVEF